MENKLKLKEAMELATDKFWDSLFQLLNMQRHESPLYDNELMHNDFRYNDFIINGTKYRIWLTYHKRAGIWRKDETGWNGTWVYQSGTKAVFPYGKLLNWLVNDIASRY